MKKIKIALMLILLVVTSGCGVGLYSNNYQTENGKTGEFGLALIPKQVSAVEHAHADLIRSQAKMNIAMAEAVRSGQSGSIYKNIIIGVITNDLPDETIIVSHPEMSQKITIPPGGFSYLYVEQIPQNLYVRGTKGGHRLLQTFKNRKPYNGLITEFGVRVVLL